MRQQIDALGIKGSVLIIRKGKILLNYADSNTTDTSYLINSAQKSLTAAMVMRLVQDGTSSRVLSLVENTLFQTKIILPAM